LNFGTIGRTSAVIPSKILQFFGFNSAFAKRDQCAVFFFLGTRGVGGKVGGPLEDGRIRYLLTNCQSFIPSVQ
jgi:hypothetical protein